MKPVRKLNQPIDTKAAAAAWKGIGQFLWKDRNKWEYNPKLGANQFMERKWGHKNGVNKEKQEGRGEKSGCQRGQFWSSANGC